MQDKNNMFILMYPKMFSILVGFPLNAGSYL